MTDRRAILLGLALSGGFLLASPLAAAERLPVVASFSILGDMTRNIGGDLVEVTTLVGPDGDGHVYEPTPVDAQKAAAARVLVVNGLGFEGWMDRLQDAAGFKGVKVVAAEGVAPLANAAEEEEAHDHDHGHAHGHAEEADHDHGPTDPHAWQSLANARIYVANILAGLSAADPANAATYEANAERYTAELDALDAEIRARLGAIPEARRVVVTSHDAFAYFADAYGLRFAAPQGVSTDAEASAADVAALIRQIRSESIAAVFIENIADARLIEQIMRETEAKIGGTLYSDALSGPDGPAPTYLDMFRHNLRTLAEALTS